VIDNEFGVILGGKTKSNLVHIPPNPLVTCKKLFHDILFLLLFHASAHTYFEDGMDRAYILRSR
jgi:hypothetical protein